MKIVTTGQAYTQHSVRVDVREFGNAVHSRGWHFEAPQKVGNLWRYRIRTPRRTGSNKFCFQEPPLGAGDIVLVTGFRLSKTRGEGRNATS